MVKKTQKKFLLVSSISFLLFFSGIGVMTQAINNITLDTSTSDSFLTYFGGARSEYVSTNEDLGIADVTVDSGDNIIFVGRTNSDDYPVTAEAYQTERVGIYDVYLTKVNSDISLSFSTLIGGTGNDWATCVVTDSNDNIIIAGTTSSTDFPVLTAYQDTHGGGGPVDNLDGFITKFNSAGELLWSTYIGGNLDDWIYGICLDSSDNIVVTGSSYSTNLPVTANAAQSSYGSGGVDAYVIRIAVDGQSILYCSYLGGSANDWGYSLSYIDDILVLGGGTGSNDIPTKNNLQSLGGGYDVLIAKFASNGSLILSSYIGGTDDEYCQELAIDSKGNTFITGLTASTDFPVSKNALQPSLGGEDDAFIVKLNNSDIITYSSYFGSTNDEVGFGLAIDSTDSIIITGITDSDDLVNTVKTTQNTLAGGDDAFIVKFNASDFAIDYCSYIGGYSVDHGADVAVDSNDNIIVYGFTYSDDLSVSENALQSTTAGQYEIFINRFKTTTEDSESKDNGSSSPSFETFIVFVSIVPLFLKKRSKLK